MDLSNIEEKVILKSLVKNPTYFDKIIPYLSEDLFSENNSRKMYECIFKYYGKYKRMLNAEVLDLFVGTIKGVSEEQYRELNELLDYIKEPYENIDVDWLTDKTIEWIRKRKYYQAIIEAAGKFDKGDLDQDLSNKINDALAFSIDENIGLEMKDIDNKWDLYTSVNKKYPFSLNSFNLMTQNGVERGTLNLFLSSTTGGGKTLTKCFLAGQYMLQGLNVLYITLEMGADNITKRIDASLLKVPMDDIVNLGEQGYKNRMNNILKPTSGRLIVKQYPPTTCNTNHLRRLIKDLKLKMKFAPDVLVVDYLQLMASCRYTNEKRYLAIQSITEELRGLCIEENMIGWSSMQSNRTGLENPEELDLSSISESYGASFGTDLIVAIITNEQFKEQGKLYFKVLKNRYNRLDINNKFFLGVDYPTMSISDLGNEEDQAKQIFSSADLSSSYSAQLDKAKKGLNFGGLK